MQLHESDRIGAVHRSPSPETVAAWARLVRVQQHVLAAVEADLKAEGFPPLAWYDALLELSRATNGRMRPVGLEKTMLLPQYSTSRLTERGRTTRRARQSSRRRRDSSRRPCARRLLRRS